MEDGNYKIKRSRVFTIGFIIVLGTAIVLLQLFIIQVINFKTYQDMVLGQIMADIPISPQRGIIYDRNMKILANNAPVEEICISPVDIKTKEKAELIARGLSEILGVDYDNIYEKTQWSKRQYASIKHYVEINLANKVREFIDENKIDAIYLRPETKRVYPFSNLAAQLIGFTGMENESLKGRFGVEYQYDEYLRGVPGRIIMAKNGMGKSMDSEYSTYIDAQNGYNLVLTIDWVIQKFLENNLEIAFSESQPRERVTGIVMDVNTGEILAMATLPSFDLNDPFYLDPDILPYINLDQKTLDSIYQKFDSEEEREKERNKAILYKLWNNKAICEPYEPGSTFKVITASMALEEKVVKPTDTFNCSGSYVVVPGTSPIHCHLLRGHGSGTFAYLLQQSCNPTMMQVAERIGIPTFLKYFEAFGYRQKTGIDLPSEAMSIVHNPAYFKSMELAISSFGQRFKITPIQQIAGISAVANGGRLITPHVVKAIIDNDGNVIKSFEPEIKRTVISAETTRTVSRILAEGVAGNGAARNAYVKGYDVAAKTGTSEKEIGTTGRIGSCIAYAPADNPQVAVMIIVDEPSVGSVYGGVIAAPFVSKTLADVLPYLGIEPNYSDVEKQIIIKYYGMQPVSSVREDILSKGLTCTVIGDGEFVKEQIPKAGSSLLKNGNVILYTDNIPEKKIVAVPDVKNMNIESASKYIIGAGLNINIAGAESMSSNATAVKQDPAAGAEVSIGTIVTVEFRHNSLTD